MARGGCIPGHERALTRCGTDGQGVLEEAWRDLGQQFFDPLLIHGHAWQGADKAVLPHEVDATLVMHLAVLASPRPFLGVAGWAIWCNEATLQFLERVR